MRSTNKLAFGAMLTLAISGLAPAASAGAAVSAPPAETASASTSPADPAGGPVGDPPAATATPGVGTALPDEPAPVAETTAPGTTPMPAPGSGAPQDPEPVVSAGTPEPAPAAPSSRSTAPAAPAAPAAPSAPATGKAPQAAFAPLVVTSHTTRDVYVTGLTTLAGTGTPGAKITATNQWGTVMGTAVVDETGDWRILRNLGPTTPSYVITFTQTAENGSDSRQIELVYVATNVPVIVTSHSDGEVYETGTNTFTGTGTIGATLTATNQWGTVMGSTTIGASGTWSFKRFLGPTDPGYVLTFTSRKGAEIRSATITLVFPELVPVTVTSPDISSGTIDRADEHVVFTGTGTPFATLTGVNQWGTAFGETKVDKNGHWEFRRWVAAGTHYDVTFTQVDTAGKTLVSTPFSFTARSL